MTASPTNSQIALKVGAIFLNALGAAFECVAEFIWKCGGLRGELTPMTGPVKWAWNSKPLPPEAAKKIKVDIQIISNYRQKSFYEISQDSEFYIKNMKNSGTEDQLKKWEENIARMKAYTKLTRTNFGESEYLMTSVLNGDSSKASFDEGIKELKKLHPQNRV